MKKLLSLLVFSVVFVLGLSAQKDISGSVTDDDGSPLIGANIIVKETTIGTIADIDGFYTLSVPQDAESVMVSFTGYTVLQMHSH